MAHEWNIRPRGSVCERCQTPFAEGQVCVSSIAPRPAGDAPAALVRLDCCQGCWTAAPDPAAISVWQSPYHAPPPPPKNELASRQTAEDLLRRLLDDADPARASVVYILAVMLERRKILIERDVMTQPDGSLVRLYEHRRTGEAFLVPDPALRLDQLGPVQEEVTRLLSSPPDTPTDTPPAPLPTPPET